jgi:anaphase-promoting complex subunit 10
MSEEREQMQVEATTYLNVFAEPKDTEELVEIGDEAVWILSSAKAGNGIEQLRDGDNNTFWQ